jgi:hypothetical protein
VLRFFGGNERPLREETVLLIKGMLERRKAPRMIAAAETAFLDLERRLTRFRTSPCGGGEGRDEEHGVQERK